MTFFGKILVVLIFVMSLVFMTFTIAVYSTHRNWRDLVANPENGLKVQIQRAQEELTKRQNEKEVLQNQLALERASRVGALAALETRASELDSQLRQAQQRLDQLSAEKSEAIEGLKQAQNEMQRLKDEVDSVRKEIRTTRQDRDEQLARAIELTDRLNQGEGELRRLKERNQGLINQLAQAQLVLDRNDLSVHTPVDGQPPKVDGVVTAIREGNLVEVSVGADEGLRRGHTLDVYRDSGGYLGRLMVIETNPDRSVTRIVPEFRQGVIRKGDRVATKLL
jgi:vacuolar-type H+-ATPase subunit I/STV1